MSGTKRVLLISSVGGHLEQLLGLKGVIDEFETYIVTEKNKSTVNLENKYSSIFFIPYLSRKNLLSFIINFIKGIFISFRYYSKIRPDVIVTTGSGAVLPMCLIGKLFGSKVVFIETFSRIESKTKTGKVAYFFADLFIVQWEELLEIYPKAVYIGHIY
ncbi:PssD/Cps14F family polysaccharide biosynthesis glycosyltransferase [Maribacter sp. HTCC2170]|uniref:PssD/Cps14F family polysaccharide biosynthesis glycosyltransferase n=1 Tax=Maribacter sp. (strain HTCC2170 / KCCM 42371) TaxID=313603 RepID=UPI00006BD22C|nr:PssD/Cps14F family polysaccharide biosynthesis glycosyltransferase [Maribacter sp. HTCC2170]EAR02767.1 polysaccharide biosynthesis protein CpsF [Maribacter sp. HTCC2170]